MHLLKRIKLLRIQKGGLSPFGDLERKVMEILWKNKETSLSVKEVHQELGEKEFAYTTIMTVLDRLYHKGVLGRKKEGKAYYYFPLFSKEEFQKRIARELMKNLAKEDFSSLVFAFEGVVEDLSPEEIKHLKELLKKRGIL